MHLDDPTKDPRRKTSEESTPSADRQDDRGGPGGAAIQFERKGDGPVAAGQVASVEQATRETVAGASTAFPHQEAIQRSFGTHRVDGLQSIVGGPAGPMNRSLESNAFTVEGRVAFSQQPDLRQAAHEATHALQQQRGLVPAGSVSRPGDGFERQADRVADQVVAGRSAEDELDSMQGGGGSGAALQFDGSKKNVNLVDTVIKGRGGETAGKVNTGTGSMASDADFEKEAVEFERKLGARAQGDGHAHSSAMAQKALAYLDAKAGMGEKSGKLNRLNDLLSAIGSDDKGIAGSVGKGANDVKAALTRGGLREQMTHVVNFMTYIGSQQNPTEVAQVNALVDEGSKIDVAKITQLKEKYKDKGGKGWLFDESGKNPFADPSASGGGSEHGAGTHHEDKLKPGHSAVSVQEETRQEAVFVKHKDQEEKLRSDRGEKKKAEYGVSQSDRTVSQANEAGQLGKGELTFLAQQMGIANADKMEPEQLMQAIGSKRMLWSEGAKRLMMNEEHWWIKAMREQSLPLKGGPSGTTNRIMQVGEMMNYPNKDGTRLAAIGYLLPIHAHSLVEVMEGARPYGTSGFRGNKEIYKDVRPYSEEELKSLGGGRFPGESKTTETGPATTGPASDSKKTGPASDSKKTTGPASGSKSSASKSSASKSSGSKSSGSKSSGPATAGPKPAKKDKKK